MKWWYYIHLHKDDALFPAFSGLQIHDTCNQDDLTRRHLYHVITATRDVRGQLLSSPTSDVAKKTMIPQQQQFPRRKKLRDLMQNLQAAQEISPPLLGKCNHHTGWFKDYVAAMRRRGNCPFTRLERFKTIPDDHHHSISLPFPLYQQAWSESGNQLC